MYVRLKERITPVVNINIPATPIQTHSLNARINVPVTAMDKPVSISTFDLSKSPMMEHKKKPISCPEKKIDLIKSNYDCSEGHL